MKTFKHLLFAFLFIISSAVVFAQGPPPPPPGDHGDPGNQPAGGAPIGGGLGVLLVLGAAYGGKKVWDMRKEKV